MGRARALPYYSTRRAVPERSWVQSLLPTTEVEPGFSTFGGMLVPVLQLISTVCKTGTSLYKYLVGATQETQNLIRIARRIRNGPARSWFAVECGGFPKVSQMRSVPYGAASQTFKTYKLTKRSPSHFYLHKW
jgi:hypothetical protein